MLLEFRVPLTRAVHDYKPLKTALLQLQAGSEFSNAVQASGLTVRQSKTSFIRSNIGT
ncbi:MAG: hypothetical protein HKP56_09270 [Anderseniella sp.]|nr:hypothetical protein [Anderseniella sp.]